MKAQVLTGSKNEIVETLTRMEGAIHEAIVFVEEPADSVPAHNEDLFAEMEPFTVKAGGVDYTRESLYTRLEGE